MPVYSMVLVGSMLGGQWKLSGMAASAELGCVDVVVRLLR